MTDYYLYYCPYCGKKQNKYNVVCENCEKNVTTLKSKYERDYYFALANKKNFKVTETKEWDDYIQTLIIKEAKENPLFDSTLELKRKEMTKTQKDKLDAYFTSQKVSPKNEPKCPTCGSTNIKKISTASKVAGAVMFGLLSKTAKSQFHCQNCGYKW